MGGNTFLIGRGGGFPFPRIRPGNLGIPPDGETFFCRCAAFYPETSGATPAPRRTSLTRFPNLHHAVCAIGELFEAGRRDPLLPAHLTNRAHVGFARVSAEALRISHQPKTRARSNLDGAIRP